MPPRTRQRRRVRSLSSLEEEGGGAKTTLATCSEKPGQKQRAEMAAETVGGREQGGEGDAGRPDSEVIFGKLDARVLDCPICSERLVPPIFQCEVGHVLCSVCHGKVRSNLCPTCFQAISSNRCFAIEQMADAVKVPCSNFNFGCNKYITYYQKEEHEKLCMHAPCFCPEDGCSFEGSTASLLNHFVTEHKWSPTKFSYDKAQRISIPRYRRFVLLVGEDQSLFLMVNTFAHIGNALTTVCIRPHESGPCYSSKISAVHRPQANKGRYVFQMDPHVASSSLHGGVRLGRFFLLVPPDLVDEWTDELTVNFSIEKIKCAEHH